MLTLIVPGLIWPYQALLDMTGGLPPAGSGNASSALTLSGMGIFLGRGKMFRQTPITVPQAIAQLLNLQIPAGFGLPAAALRTLTLGTPSHPQDKTPCLCLDPVHLAIEQTRLRVDPPQNLALTMDEAHAIAASLAPTFSSLGTLSVLAPSAWNLRLHSPAFNAPLAPSLPECIGRAAPPLPATPDAAPWRKAINEANMLLHSHPVNLARAGQSKPTINSLWPWGAGNLPEQARLQKTKFAAIYSDDPVIQGAALSQQMASFPTPSNLSARIENNALYVLDLLDLPTRTGDTNAWRINLLRLENDYFKPLMDALRRGRIPALRLIAPGDTASVEVTFQRYHLWQFWRPPAPLTALAAPPRHLSNR
ncbi:MAG: hypothetical protein WA112_11320 [Rugosibacter sp.]|jgi:hypothetical protein|nr:hypothetical protein [Rugosibacter sp.]